MLACGHGMLSHRTFKDLNIYWCPVPFVNGTDADNMICLCLIKGYISRTLYKLFILD